MIKYVVNSGGLHNQPERAKIFYSEIVKGLTASPKILLCFFALPREDWEAKYKQDLLEYESIFQTNKPTFNSALPDSFEKQSQECDAIYIHGGDDHLVQYWLKQFDIPKLFDGKVVATNSASSNAVSKHFWTCDWRKCLNGLGILPIKFIPHYKSDYGTDDPRGSIDWDIAYKELENFGDKQLPIYALEEGEYEVFEV